ncbi:MAG: VWA domain-containing protein, partial [Verrucomicrobiia bacterium]
MLQRAKSANKHVILFSDAQDSEQPGNYKDLVGKMRKAGITISVIGLGTDKDVDADLLKDIAKLGEGNVYFTDRPTEIPRIFAQDTFAVARNTFIKEATAVKILTDFSTLGAQGQWAPPALGGYNLTYPRKRASVGMMTQDEYNAPGVAWWQVGAGR